MTTTRKLAATLATMAAMTGSLTVPAMAQQQGADQYAPQGRAALQQAAQGEEVSVTGVIERLPSDGGPSPYGITDEASGVLYVLDGGEGDFSAYEGQRVTVTGTAQGTGAAYENLNVSGITAARAGGAPPAGGPSGDRTATLSFEVETDCAPPEGTTLLGYVPAEGLMSAVLSDPDGDGVYAGSVEVPRFAPGPTPPGTEPVSVPVLIGQNVGDDSGNIETIKDFGQVKLDGDEAFSASASFCDDGAGNGNGGAKPVDPAPVDPLPVDPAPVVGAEDDGAVVSGDTSNADKGGGSADAGDGGSRNASSGVGQGGASLAAKVLPSTGGILPVAGLAGIVLIAGGLLFRGISR